MCGIAGLLHLEPDRPADPEQVRVMTRTLAHRGPDGEGVWCRGPVGLGHRRLSIIDLHTGDQPMHRPASGLSLVFNGEIYNYIELREELRRAGQEFQTDSDTEVILAAYEAWGPDCLNHFNGMWALALWDAPRRRLLLARDRIGEKPLYYCRHGNTLLFASEMKSLFAGGAPRAFNQAWLEVYLALGYMPCPHTFYRDLVQLPPGHRMRVEDGQVHLESYWSLPYVPEEDMLRDPEEVDSRFAELLNDSVRIRMRSDVPFGAFLSGGLDSSIVVASMADRSPHPVETFTIGFREKDYDERPLAASVAAMYHTNHHEHEVEPEAFEEALEHVLHHYDEPFGDSSAMPTGHVCRFAREHVKMVLTGDGGDEVLSGYTIYQGEKFAERYRRIPAPLGRCLPPVAGALARVSPASLRDRLVRVGNVSRASLLSPEDRLIDKASWTKGLPASALLTPFERVDMRDFMHDFMRGSPHQDPFYRLMHYHFHLSLPDDMLVKVDRMSMACGLETRVPFLDHRLVEFMVGVHKDVKMEGYERKSVLRRAFGHRFPPALLQAPKKGFSVPLRHWFRDDRFGAVRKRLDRLEDLGIRPDVLGGIIQRNAAGLGDYGNFLWMLALLERWVDQGGRA